jgi:hypothetical protein
MADPYIDQFETLIYGKFAREQLAAVLVGKIPELDGMVQYALKRQQAVDDDMTTALANQPAPPVLDAAKTLAEAGDTLVRFGAHIESLKGHPLDLKTFFRGDAPSVLARRRLTKLAAGAGYVLDEAKKNQAQIRDASYWIDELTTIYTDLQALEKQQRATKVAQVEMGPEVAAARLRWLDVYNANKLLVRGMLAHYGKAELLPLIFDDLAEVHRVAGVSDEVPPANGGTTATTGQGGTGGGVASVEVAAGEVGVGGSGVAGGVRGGEGGRCKRCEGLSSESLNLPPQRLASRLTAPFEPVRKPRNHRLGEQRRDLLLRCRPLEAPSSRRVASSGLERV